MRVTVIGLVVVLSGCSGLAWNTTLADHPQVRNTMLDSVVPGQTTEAGFRARWGNPTQRVREGGQVSYVYRNMTNPPGFYFPQFGDSTAFVIVQFQYGVATTAYSSDSQGCRATFAPRPPGETFFNPTSVKPVNCGVAPGADAGRDKGLLAILTEMAGGAPPVPATGSPQTTPLVPEDTYVPGGGGKYR